MINNFFLCSSVHFIFTTQIVCMRVVYFLPLSHVSRECVCVERLKPLMCSLEVLHLGYNGISNLSDLQLNRLSSLRALFLQGDDKTQHNTTQTMHMAIILIL